MKLDEYQKSAMSTAIYQHPLLYPALGLAGEIGELTEAVLSDTGTQTSASRVMKEAGDVLWYIAAVASDSGLTLSEITETEEFPDPFEYALEIQQYTNLIVQSVGVVAENVKKTLRDNVGVLTDDRQQNIKRVLRLLIWDLSNLLSAFNISLLECAFANVSKLKSRQDRGKLTGDGDER